MEPAPPTAAFEPTLIQSSRVHLDAVFPSPANPNESSKAHQPIPARCKSGCPITNPTPSHPPKTLKKPHATTTNPDQKPVARQETRAGGQREAKQRQQHGQRGMGRSQNCNRAAKGERKLKQAGQQRQRERRVPQLGQATRASCTTGTRMGGSRPGRASHGDWESPSRVVRGKPSSRRPVTQLTTPSSK